MRVSLVALLFLASTFAASAQGTEKAYTLNLSGTEIDVLAKALIEQPYKFVGPLFDKIKAQVAEQNKPAEGPKELKKD
jgi:hypothetical protein